MTSLKPYYFRAILEWILDNNLTPYMLVDATQENIMVPRDFVKNGQIVFDITPIFIENFSATNEVIEFDARFRGVKQHIYVPISALIAIYSKENNSGMVFDSTDDAKPFVTSPTSAAHTKPIKKQGATPSKDPADPTPPKSTDSGPKSDKPKKKSHLKIVK